jgi:hypothetical protein
MRGGASIALAMASAVLVHAQAPREARPAGTAALAGGVIIEGTNADPARNAVVTLNSASAGVHRTTVADANGRFAFDGLPAGAYLVAASKPGYVTSAYGARRPGRPGTPIAVAESARVEIELRLPRGAVVTGRVLDDTGAPAFMAAVHVLQYRWVNGRRTLTSPAGVFDAPRAIADDRGEYRIYGLPPGEYVVAAAPGIGSPMVNPAREIGAWEFQKAARLIEGRVSRTRPSREPARTWGYAPVFYPGTSDITQAQPLRLRAGEEQSGVDLAMSLVPVATLSGTVSLPDGVQPGAVQVSMVPAGDHLPTQGIGTGGAFLGFANARLDADGRFQVTGVAPGEHVIFARATKPAIHVAIARVFVSGADASVSLTMQPAATLSGRVEMRTAVPTEVLTGLRVQLSLIDAADGMAVASAPAVVGRDGTFTLTGVTPGRYRVDLLDVPDAWTLTAATWGGRDVFDGALDPSTGAPSEPVIVTLSDRPSELTGRLQDAVGQSAPEYFVVVFPADRARWMWQSRRIHAVRPSSDGRYTVRGLPAGDYLLGVVSDVEPNEWFDPAFLETLAPAAVRVTIAAGDRTTMDLRIAGGSDQP